MKVCFTNDRDLLISWLRLKIMLTKYNIKSPLIVYIHFKQRSKSLTILIVFLLIAINALNLKFLIYNNLIFAYLNNFFKGTGCPSTLPPLAMDFSSLNVDMEVFIALFFTLAYNKLCFVLHISGKQYIFTECCET